MLELKTIYRITIVLVILLTSRQGISQQIDFVNDRHERVWVDSVMNNLSLEDKIGQLIFVRAAYYENSERRDSLFNEIEKLKPGGIVLFAGKPVEHTGLINDLQRVSSLPLLVSIDAEWGLAMRYNQTIDFPYQMALGAISDNDLIYKMGKEIARQCRRMGIHINFAPVVDVNNNPNNPVINYRSFGESPANVAEKGWAYASGLQDGGVLPTAKHFPGHGDTDVDSHLDLPSLPFQRQRLDSMELVPFRYMINRGLNGVMIAHLDIPALDPRKNRPSSLSKPITTEILRSDLGFEGLVFTDALEMKGIAKYFSADQAAIESFKAGNDIILLPEDAPLALSGMAKAFRAGTLSSEDLDRRVRKILSTKYKFGLHQNRFTDLEGLLNDLNRPEAKLLQRKLIESSLTLITDRDSIVPVRDLERKKIATLSIGSETRTAFQERLEDYTSLRHFNIGLKSTSQELNDLKNDLKEFDLIIIGLHHLGVRPRNIAIYSEEQMKFLDQLLTDQQCVIVSFRNPYTLNNPIFSKASALATAYYDRRLTEDLAAQAVFGGIGFSGKLPVSINEQWAAGRGISSNGGIRFKYTLPEEVGIDGEKLETKIDEVIQLGLDSAAYPGAQVLIAKDGKVFFHKTYGYHTYEKNREVGKDDIYDFASVTKITGALPAVMMLHDQGKFDLDNSLGDDFSYFKRSNKGDLQWRNILAHHARLKAWIPYWTTTLRKNGNYRRNTLSTSLSENYPIELKEGLYLHKDYKSKIYRMIKKSPLNEKEEFLYSGLSFYLYPEIVKRKSGLEFEQFLKEKIYRPLGAYTLTFNPLKHFDIDRLVPTERDTFFRKMQIKGVVHDEGAAMMDGVSGNAGLFGTANDLAKLMQMYQNRGVYGGDTILSEYTLRKFTTCQFCEEDNHRGLGFDKPLIKNKENGTPAPSASQSSFGHSGYTGTFTWADPETGILFIFFSNRVYPTRLNTKLYRLNIRPRIHQAVYDLAGFD